MTIDLKDFEEITDIEFSNEGAHLAVCHKAQSGSANGWHQPLILKSEDVNTPSEVFKALQQVTVSLSFEEFLRKFFYMYHDDAELLAKILGFETEFEYGNKDGDYTEAYTDYVQERADKVEILRTTDLSELSADTVLELIGIQKTFEANFEQFEVPEDSGESDLQKSENTDQVMKIEDILKSAEVQDLITAEVTKATEAKDKELTDMKEDLASATEQLNKAAEELTTFRQEKEAKRKEGVTNFVKSLTFLQDEDQDVMVEAIMKASTADSENTKAIVSALEKAQAEIVKTKEEFISEDTGVEVKDEPVDVNKTAALADELEAKYANKDFI